MRFPVYCMVLGALVFSGCGGKQASVTPWDGAITAAATDTSMSTNTVAPDSQLIVTPETGLVGKVAKVNAQGRFVVLNYPIGHLPALDQRLMLYRAGLKVGEVKATGPQLDDNVVADVLAGEAAVGDEAREQ